MLVCTYGQIEVVDGTPLAAHFQPSLQSLGSHYSKKTRVKVTHRHTPTGNRTHQPSSLMSLPRLSIQRKSLNPEWSESIDFAIRDHFDYSRLHAWFRLMCVAVTGKSIALAEGQLPLADLLSADIPMLTHRNSLGDDDSSAAGAGAGESESVAMSPSKPGLVRGRSSIEKKVRGREGEREVQRRRLMGYASVFCLPGDQDPGRAQRASGP